jgi:uncharacterized protein (DUF2267 family)
MQYEDFIAKVVERTGWEREQAEAVTRATLATLAARITHGEAEDVAAQLPQELKGPLQRGPDKAVPFDVAEFKRRVAEHAGVSQDEAEQGIRAVFATLSEAITGGEFDDVLSQLPNEYSGLVGETGRP